ncbi:hypothetical protein ACFL2Z_04850 [Candidatus Eisenbacteria bacterium]|uniref:FlgD Ig-like domain-containing protein n=1 Tax=Eiseniibacteriota bacterium TaxID=2212470 RepID=A0ABV6YQA0_UNCEI
MSKLTNSLFPGIAAMLLLTVGVCMGGVNLVPPEVEVAEGDRLVDLVWRDLHPESLVSVEPPVLGTISFPWDGMATLSSEGFYLGACDWTYDFLVSNVRDTIELSWQEIIDWREGTIASRQIQIPDVEVLLDLSNGMRVKVDSTGLFLLDATGWAGPLPAFHGIYVGGYPELGDLSVDYTFTCTSGGEVTGTAGDVEFTWVNDLDSTGSFTVTQADMSTHVDRGLKVKFPAGTYVTDDGFSVEVMVPLVSGNRFAISGETFEGYLVIRRSVEDRESLYKVRANISKCDTFEFFADAEGHYDPWGDRSYSDRGVVSDQPGVTPDPDLETVLNGFPYEYAVVTWDWSDDHFQVLSPINWYSVSPSVPPNTTSLDKVTVVPNPYVLSAGWEVDDSKLLFTNVPDDATIRIYDVAGGYVDTVRPTVYSYDQSEKQGSAEWDLRNAAGKQITSGVYIYHIESKLGESLGRFIVVR